MGDTQGLLSQLIDSVCQFQQSLASDWLDVIDRGESPDLTFEAVAECCNNVFEGASRAPEKLLQQQLEHWQRQLQLYHNFVLKLCGEEDIEPVIRPRVGDRRFSDDAWNENPLFDFIKQSYLLATECLGSSVEALEGLDERRRARLGYVVRQACNALAPSNFPMTNPEILQRTLDSRGANLVQGMKMMAEDKSHSARILNICMSRPQAFELGVDLAATPGQVVAENRLMQLIQYAPETPDVGRVPVLIVPSWINKYYVLDLSPENSFVRYLVETGHTVFMISWVNPDASYRDTGFDDYMQQGVLAACTRIREITGEAQVAGIGYCLGGALLASTQAWCAAGGGEQPFRSATYLATSIDFSNPGDMGVLIDDISVRGVERQLQLQGYLDGRLMSAGFNLLKENELFWNYYVQNYLRGERPAPFDLLHWNTDNTNVPAATHRFVLRELHLRNGLMRDGGMELAGRRIDLSRVTTPTYALATDRDHIASWQSAYAVTRRQSGEVRFVLSGSGHIAGVVNPPAAGKYYHYINPRNEEAPMDWLDGAFKVEGSWWPDWVAWQQVQDGERVPARVPRDEDVIEPAPGRYVRRRLDLADAGAAGTPRAA